MKIVAQSTREGYEIKMWLSAAVLRFSLPENSVESWRVALEKLQGTVLSEIGEALRTGQISFLSSDFELGDPDAVIERLLDDPDAIIERLAVCKIAAAWNHVRTNEHQVLEIINSSFLRNFACVWPFDWLLQAPKYNIEEDEEWMAELEKRAETNEKKRGFLALFLPNLDLLRAFIREYSRLQITNAVSRYASLLRAVLGFLDSLEQDRHHNAEFRLMFRRFSRKYRPALCALLVENDDLSLDERQQYVNFLFEPQVPERERWSLLGEILDDLEEEVENDPKKQQVVETLASLMAQQYLKRYMLDRALHIWGKVVHLKKEPWLQMMLGLYKMPHRWLLLILLVVLISWVLPWAGVFTLLLFFVFVLFILGTVSMRFLSKQGFSSLELFLPRLAGAVFVGSSILGLENTVWDVSMKMPLFSWLMITVASCLGALAYIFLEVHKSKRLQPLEDRGGENKTTVRSRYSLMSRSVDTAWQFFSIGALEALGINTLIASFVPLDEQLECVKEVIWSSWHGLHLLACQANYQAYGIVVDWPPFIHLTYFPKIIILWAGLSLLLGAFAQLLWQDSQITAS